MLTKNDIETLLGRFKEVFATREEVVLKEEMVEAMSEVFPTKVEMDNRFDEMKKDFSNLQTSIDSYAGKTEDYKQEMGMLSHQVDRHESWIKRIADKAGIKLEHFEKPDQKEQASI